jgi:DNA-binding NarL/FixJ family response regulator
MLRILLVDDNRRFLEAVRRFLARESFEVVGHALSGTSALEQVAQLQPDLVLMDLALPHMNGLEVTRRIKARPNPPRVIMLTLHDSPAYVAEAKAMGADGFVTKSDFGTQLLPVIQTLFAARDNGSTVPLKSDMGQP